MQALLGLLFLVLSFMAVFALIGLTTRLLAAWLFTGLVWLVGFYAFLWAALGTHPRSQGDAMHLVEALSILIPSLLSAGAGALSIRRGRRERARLHP